MESAWTLTDLSDSEVHAIVATLSDSDREKTRVWKKGWPQWRSLYDKEVQFLLRPWPRKTQHPPLPVIIKKDAPANIVETVVNQQPQFLNRQIIARKHKRHLMTVNVKVIQGPSQFVSQTRDVSAGGMCLIDPLPSWVAGYCSVILELPGRAPIEMICSVVEDQSAQKFRLELDQSRPNPDFLNWIESLEKTQKAG